MRKNGGAMKKTEIKTYKERLLALRARLRGDVNQMADAALNKNRSEASGDLSSMPIHMADLGTDNFEQEFTLSLMQTEEDTLGMIEAALERIEDGVYGAMKAGKAASLLQGHTVSVLGPDLAARGIGEDKLADGVNIVDYAGFVDMVEASDKVQSWL